MSELGDGRKVVIAIDPSKRPLDPLRLGGRLARRVDLPVVIVTVFTHHPLLTGPESEGQLAARAGAQEDLLELGRTLEGVRVEKALVLAGSSPARVLHDLSTTSSVALLVVGSTTRGAMRRVLPGSVAQQLLSGAACPVAVAPHGYGEEEPRDLSTVGVAFDGSPESEQALAGARRLAGRAGARLRIITVVPRLAFGAVPASTMAPAASASRLLEEGLRAAHDEALAESREVAAVESVFLVGDPVDVLLDQSRDVDLLVAGSRGYGPLGAVLLGSTTRELTHGAQCPLIVVPRGRSLLV